jgi:dihydropyrimidinase
MALLIKGGEIVTGSSRYVADIWCEGETITQIGSDLTPPDGAEVIDARGKFIFPGFIDPHTHIYLPFMGTFAKDNYTTGTQAAIVGGTTTIFDMCIPSRAEEPLAGFHTWQAQAEGRACCDYSFHMGVTKFDENSEAQLREIVAAGVQSFKVFLAYKGAFGIEDPELWNALALARDLTALFGGILLATAVKILALMKAETVGPIFEEMAKAAGTEGSLARRAAQLSEKLRLMKISKPASAT